jgi:predicted secreted Zn-dependent protease
MIRSCSAWLALILAALTTPAVAEVVEQVSYVGYDVKAEGGKSLAAMLNDASPFRGDGRVLYAYTTWHIAWNYRYTQSPGSRCGIQSVRTVLTVTITLPAPTDPTILSSVQFTKLIAALRMHEQGHYTIARNAASDVDRGIAALAQADSCPQLGTRANDFGTKVIDDAKQVELQYDRDTQHGKTQGAWLN